MSSPQIISSLTSTESEALSKLRRQYGCGPVEFAGSDNALYERHLTFDNVVDVATAGPHEKFEAVGRSVRDVLSQRWLLTESTYLRQNPKRVYYLSMEYLLGRSLANNVTNLLLEPLAEDAAKQKKLDWLELLEQEPDAGLGNGGLGRLGAQGHLECGQFAEVLERSYYRRIRRRHLEGGAVSGSITRRL
jgi:glycogen phosphorylase